MNLMRTLDAVFSSQADYTYQPHLLGDLAHALSRDMTSDERDNVAASLPAWSFFTAYGRSVDRECTVYSNIEKALPDDAPPDCKLAVSRLCSMGWTVVRSNVHYGTYAVLLRTAHHPPCIVWCVHVDFYLSGEDEPPTALFGIDPIRLETFDEPNVLLGISVKDDNGVRSISIIPPVEGSRQLSLLWAPLQFMYVNTFCQKGALWYSEYTSKRCIALNSMGGRCTSNGLATRQLMDLFVGVHYLGHSVCTCARLPLV